MAGILSVVERAYHGTIEEQDDTILWVSHMLKNAGADLSILLRSNAVNYAVRGQDASGLNIGGVDLSVPPRIDDDVIALTNTGAPVYVVAEDLADRGISAGDLCDGVQTVARADLAKLFDEHDAIWHW
ncbi:MAG: DsrE family protein [Chloroflexota bacterium]|nr:DsrE family protein [Chloroflexota bacterium]MDE2969936.1 DsrE family protein [Chloroflexota bacterium]